MMHSDRSVATHPGGTLNIIGKRIIQQVGSVLVLAVLGASIVIGHAGEGKKPVKAADGDALPDKKC